VKRRTPPTEADIVRWQQQGLGTGDGAAYKPWIDARDFASSGRKSRAWGSHSKREHHLLSDHEYFAFLALDFRATVADIKEQFPMQRDETLDIAEQLNVRHPVYPKTAVPVVMTTDFVVTVQSSSACPTLEAYTVKPLTDLEGSGARRILDKFEIERLYWNRRGVTLRLLTTRELYTQFVFNLDWLNYGAHLAEEDLSSVDSFLSAFERISHQEKALMDVLEECRDACKLPVDFNVSNLFRYCVWTHRIEVDLSLEIGLQHPVSLRRATTPFVASGSAV
jgi:hypothetical protein